VEVERNAFGPGESEILKKRFPAANLNVHKAVEMLLASASQVAEHAFGIVESATHGAEQKTKDVEQKTKETGREIVNTVQQSVDNGAVAGPSGSGNTAGADDEGWASDQSDASRSSDERAGRQKKRSRRPLATFTQGRPPKRITHLKSSRPAPPPPTRKSDDSGVVSGRRVPSFGSPSRPPLATDTASTKSRDSPPEEARGRRSFQTELARPRHARLDTLRSSEGRSASPSRSIRWADEDTPPVRSPLVSQAPSDDERDSA
jgi:hypothetical protein